MKTASVVMACLSVTLLLCTSTAAAQAVPSTPEAAQQLVRTNQSVRLVLADGRTLDGSVAAISDKQLTLRTKTGTDSLAWDRIREISTRRNDPIWEGLIIGGAAGLVVGLLADHFDDCDPGECTALPGSIAVGAGAGIGIDLLFRKRQILYRSPSPQAGLFLEFRRDGTRTGVALSLRF